MRPCADYWRWWEKEGTDLESGSGGGVAEEGGIDTEGKVAPNYHSDGAVQ